MGGWTCSYEWHTGDRREKKLFISQKASQGAVLWWSLDVCALVYERQFFLLSEKDYEGCEGSHGSCLWQFLILIVARGWNGWLKEIVANG